MRSLRVPPSTSCLTSAKNADRFGYVSLASLTLTILTSAFSSTSSCITSPPGADAPSTPAHPLRLLGAEEQARELLAPAVDAALHRSLGQAEPVRHLLVGQALEVAQHDRLPQLLRQRLEAPAQEAAAVAVLERAVGAGAGGGGGEVEGH